nr:MAG TPA: minor tail protein [Caudoviricetes sp.]
MPKSVDGDIRISIDLDTRGFNRKTQDVRKSVSNVARAMQRFGGAIQSTWAGGEAAAQRYNAKVAKADEAVRAQENAVEALREKFDALKNGDTEPQSLKKLDARIAAAQKAFDALVDQMDAAKDKANSLDFGVDSAELQQAKADYADLADQVAAAGGKLDALKAKAESLRQNPQTTAEGKKLSRELDMAIAKLERLKTEAEFTAEAAQKTNEQYERLPKSVSKTNGMLQRLKRLAVSAFVFNAFSQGVTSLRKSLGDTLKTNTQFVNSVAKIKGNLLTAFAPIYESALPGINALTNGLSALTAQLAAFIAALSGTTAEQAADTAKNLYDQANATDKVTAATKKAEKSLASFDEINKITAGNSANKTDGIAPDFSGITGVDTSKATETGKKLAPVLDAFGEFAEKVAKAFKENIAPKLQSFGKALLSFLPDLSEMDSEDIANVLDAIAVGLAAFAAIKIGVTVTNGIANLGTALGGFFGGIAAHPVAATAVALTALAASISAISEAKYRNSKLGKMSEKLNDLHDSAQEALQASRDFRTEAEDKFKNIDTNFESLVVIADRYYDLSQKAQLSADDQNMLEYYYNYLSQHGVDLVGKIDDVTYAYKGTREELDLLLKSQLKALYVQAAQEEIVEGIKNQLRLRKKLEELQASIPDAEKQVSDTYKAYADARYTWLDKANETVSGWLGIKKDLYGDNASLDNMFEDMFNIGGLEKAHYDSAQNALRDLKQDIQDVQNEIVSSSSDLGYYSTVLKSNGEAAAGYIDDIINYARGLSEASSGIDSAKESAKNLGYSIDDDTSYSEELNKELVKIGQKEVNPDFSGLNNSLDATLSKAQELQATLAGLGAASPSIPNIPMGYKRVVPKLATGAVIPANREFLAVLGDQRSGTNVEAPLATIEQAVANVLSRMGGFGTQQAVLEIDGEKFGKLIYKLNKREGKRVGVSFSGV